MDMNNQLETPVQQEDSVQQGNSNPTPASGENWEARYKGQQAALQRFAEELKSLKDQLVQKNSEIEQLRLQLAQSKTQMDFSAGEAEKKLQEASSTVGKLQGELTTLKALQLKIKVAEELGDMSILRLHKVIPDIADEAQLKQYMSDIANWGQAQVKSREEQLLSGTVQTAAQLIRGGEPSSDQEWITMINNEQDTAKRHSLQDQYGAWLKRKYTGV